MENQDTKTEFDDVEYWDKELEAYVDEGSCSSEPEFKIWQYFKHCLATRNRFFFQNPLVPLIEKAFKENIIVLPAGSEIFRARNDEKYEYWEECRKYAEASQYRSALLKINDEPKNPQEALAMYCQEKLDKLQEDEIFQKATLRIELGFEGFDSKESGAPPCYKVGAGRCNPEKVAFLYCANDMHTAVAEIRPYIRDSVSVATLRVEKELQMVDFYYVVRLDGSITEPDGCGFIGDSFFHQIRSQFSIVNKGDKDEYLITQYLSLLAEHLGYDGISFRSSLSKGGRNYVVFKPESCTPISSKLYVIPEVKYSLVQVIPE